MTTKELFIEKQPELAGKLREVSHAPWFQLALIPVDSEVFRSATSPEFIAGASFYKETMLTMADKEDDLPGYQAQPGLIDPTVPNSVTSKPQPTK